MSRPRLPLLPLLLALALGAASRPARADDPAPGQPATPAPAAVAPAPVWHPQPLLAQPWAQRPFTPQAPLYPQRAIVDPERHSTGAMVTGIVLVSLGIIGLGTGTALAVSKQPQCTILGRSPDAPTIDDGSDRSKLPSGCPTSANQGAGMSILIGSALVAGLGIPLWIFGSQRASRYPDTASSLMRPTLLVGPGTAGLRVSF
jgi:hypothetical protein